MSIFSGIVSFFTDLFGGGDDDDDEEEGQEPYLETGDYDGGDFDEDDFEQREYSDEELAYVIESPEGELVNHPPVDFESGMNYCSEAPEGILHLFPIGDGEYEIYRTDSVT